jgi:hypothetical protein
MQRADLTTRRRSRPSARVASTSRRPRVGSCDHDRPGRRVHARRPARGSRRWAIRWAKPGRIGPYRAHHHSPATLPDIAYLQVLSGSTPPRTPCFTRERSQVRNPPRPSSELPAKRPFFWPPADLDSRPVAAPNEPLGHSLGQSPGLAERSWRFSDASRRPLSRPLAQRTLVAGNASRAWRRQPQHRSSRAGANAGTLRTPAIERRADRRDLPEAGVERSALLRVDGACSGRRARATTSTSFSVSAASATSASTSSTTSPDTNTAGPSGCNDASRQTQLDLFRQAPVWRTRLKCSSHRPRAA